MELDSIEQDTIIWKFVHKACIIYRIYGVFYVAEYKKPQ